jgi:UDP-N-acetylmuramoylalanine--D-glutamate ligase
MRLLLRERKKQTDDLEGKKVTVVGLGIEGIDLVRYLAGRGADVTVSDARPAEKLTRALNEVAGLKLHLSLGENSLEALEGADALYVSQGVPLDVPLVAEARSRGIGLHSMMEIFLRECRGVVLGITGSSGKSTVTALLDEIIRASGRKSFVGGNIGVPLLGQLPAIDTDTLVVLEISHTQMLLTDRSPHVAAVTNVTPNHLDRFSWEEYVALKRKIVAFQHQDDIAVLYADDEVAAAFASETPAGKIFTSMSGRVEADSVFLEGSTVVADVHGVRQELFATDDLRLPGRHNIANSLTAAAMALAIDAGTEAIRHGVRSFHGIPHRLELVRRVRGVGFYNDSIATTPERAVAGLRSFNEPVVLVAGGRHKQLPWSPLVDEVRVSCRAVVCFGEAGPEIADALKAGGFDRVRLASELHEAVGESARLARRGDVVLLSPACTSFDAYDNFEQRGDHFRRLVRALGDGQ